MSEQIEKIKSFVKCPSREDGIKGLMKLQQQLPENLKYRARLACLHLMQMNHDFQGIRKLLPEWKLMKSFGKQLVIRMRRRVCEEPGTIQDNQNVITKELDRLNDKNWRQFSPKKNFPDYTQFLNQVSNRSSSNLNMGVIEQKKDGQKMDKNSNSESGSIFSRLSQLQKIEKIKEKDLIPKGGVFSKQNTNRNERQDTTIFKDERIQRPSILNEKQRTEAVQLKANNEVNKKPQNQNSNPLLRKIELNQQKNQTPSKEGPKKIITFKYGQQKQKLKSDSKDQFSFSAVKARQIQGVSHKKTKGEQLDQSFLNFTNESKLERAKNQQILQRKDLFMEEIKSQRDQFVSSSRFQRSRPLFTEQQLNLIEVTVPARSYINNIFRAEGFGAIDMIKKALTME